MRKFVLILTLVLALVASAAMAQEGAMVHFVVVKADVDGVDYEQELPALKSFFIDMCGGYTQLGAGNGGSRDAEGAYSSSNNYSFIVAAPGDDASTLFEYISERFKSKPYILVWPAKQYF